MKEVHTEPPLIDKIDAVFGTRGKPVFYAWGDTIYNPQAVEITPALRAHEETHSQQQANYGSVADWWHQYLDDEDFRFEQELEAHIVEYAWWQYASGANRNQRRLVLKTLAKRLSGPLYGKLVSPNKAKALIKRGLKDANA